LITGVGVFLGLVAGVLVQVLANEWQSFRHRSNAKAVLKCEIEMNLNEIAAFEQRQKRLRERAISGQLDDSDGYDMSQFNYTALGPLIQSGHFHKMLGSESVKRYFSAARFFSNETAARLTHRFHEEHAAKTSIDFCDWVERGVAENKSHFLHVASKL